MDKGLFDPGVESEYLINLKDPFDFDTVALLKKFEADTYCNYCDNHASYKLSYNDGYENVFFLLCIEHTKQTVNENLNPFSCIDRETINGMLYAVHWFNLSNRTMYKIGRFIKPLILFDSEEFLITEYDSRINPQTEVESIFKVLDIYASVNNLARRAILTMWQIKELHKDVRLLIAKRLWNENRIDWS